MPLYEYRCLSSLCGKNFESISKPYDPVLCRHCSCQETERLISFPAGYSIRGDNSASSSPKRFNHAEQDRKEAKRERLTNWYDKHKD